MSEKTPKILSVTRQRRVMRVLFLTMATVCLTACGQTNSDVAPIEPAVELEAPQPPTTPNQRTSGVDDIDFKAYSSELASHLGLTMGETRLDAIDKIRLYFSPEPGTNIVNLTSSTFELDDGSVMLFARNDLPDDSVFAEEIYAIFSGAGEENKFNQTLAAYGLRVKCRRGKNSMEWQAKPCP